MTGDVSQSKARGGTMLMLQGWADPIVAPLQTVNFYQGLARQFGDAAETRKFARLFMVPGVGHCGGGDGPNSFNSSACGGVKPPANNAGDDDFDALARWVEDGVAPAQVVATKYVAEKPAGGAATQRPPCPYPQKAWYKGRGDTADAGSFACSVEKR